MTEKPKGWAVALERIEKEAADRSGFLDLGRLGLTELPPALFDLTHLRELNLGNALNESGNWRKASAQILNNEISASLTGLRALPDLRGLSISGYGRQEPFVAIGSASATIDRLPRHKS
jgi:internalin A